LRKLPDLKDAARKRERLELFINECCQASVVNIKHNALFDVLKTVYRLAVDEDSLYFALKCEIGIGVFERIAILRSNPTYTISGEVKELRKMISGTKSKAEESNKNISIQHFITIKFGINIGKSFFI
jgi:hypothetical protein